MATCDVDVPLLNMAFDLSPFDGFIDPDLFERLQEQARSQAAAEAAASAAPAQAAGAPSGDDSGENGVGAVGNSGMGLCTEEAVRRHLAGLVQRALASNAARSSGGGGEQAADGGHRLLALTMLCMEPECEAQAADLLWAAFDAFPGKVRSQGAAQSRMPV